MTEKYTTLEDEIRACYATWGERYYDDYYRSETAYPPVHIDIVRNLLTSHSSGTVLDAGCGPASMLRHLDLPRLARYGFDLTPEMVVEARRVLGKQGVPEDRVWEGSVLHADAFRHQTVRTAGGFDAVICFGVLPHVLAEADSTVLTNALAAVRPGGLVAVEARNELFGLFTLNRYSRTLFRDALIREHDLAQQTESPPEAAALEAALARLDERFRMDLPPVRKGYEGEPGYDEVLSRTHNPFTLRALAESAGLIDVRVLFFHFHALPPMLQAEVPELFRRASLRMEDPTDWRGHFMASAFILVGRRPE